MQKKLNEEFIEDYSERFAASVCNNFFASNSSISGPEILSLTPSKQVNFFVIKLLFNNWQAESQRLESPFFDYQAPEVRQAMLSFMNVLSQHIKVGRKEFEILLQDAVRDTLYLVMAPDIYLDIELDRRGDDELTAHCVKNILKYLKIGKSEFKAFLEDHIGTYREDLEMSSSLLSPLRLNPKSLY